jgi:hypothetical protein
MKIRAKFGDIGPGDSERIPKIRIKRERVP